MKIRAYKALARGVVLDSLRRKDLWVIAILGFLILASAGALGFFGISGLQFFVKDLAVTVLGAFSAIVAVLTGSRLMPDEIKNRTLYPLLARPITRADLIFGKFVGGVLVSWVAFCFLAALTALALASFHVPFEGIMVQYLIAKMMGLAVICALSLALSVLMTPAAAATLSFILVFGSSMMVRALVMASAGADGIAVVFYRILNAILPQVHLFDLGGRAVYIGWSPVPLWVMAGLFAYMVAYSGAMLSVAWFKFRRMAI